MKNEEIINTVVEEGMEMNEAVMVEACNKGSFIKPVAIGAGVVGAGFGLYKLGKMVYGKIKAKKEQAATEAEANTTEAVKK